MDYLMNSSSDQSSISANEEIANKLDTIEREINVKIERNDQIESQISESDYSFAPIVYNRYRNVGKVDPKVDKTLKFKSKAKNKLYYYSLNQKPMNDSKSEFNSKLLSLNNSDIQTKDILLDIYSDKRNASFIDSDNIETEILTNTEPEPGVHSNTVPIIEDTINDSLIETTTTYLANHTEYQITTKMISFNANIKHLNSLTSNTKSTSDGNVMIITEETSGVEIGEPTTGRPMEPTVLSATIRSNRIVDRIKEITAKEVLNNLGKTYFNSETQYCKPNAFTPELYNNNVNITIDQGNVTQFCIHLSHKQCSDLNVSDCQNEDIGQKCTNANTSECVLNLRSNDSDINYNYIIGWYGCHNHTDSHNNNSYNCLQYAIKLDTGEDNRLALIITASLVPIIICVAIIIIFYVKYKNKNNMKRFDCFGVKILKQMPHKSKSRKRRVDKMPNDVNSGGSAVINMEVVAVSPPKVMPKSKSVPMNEFNQYYQQNRADSGLKLAEEYEEIKEVTALKSSVRISQSTHNKPKNRFVNILPYDHTIVPLKLRDGIVGSDYINANFIAGYNSEKEYIASQAPLNSTVNDFFRMIIEQNVRIIVCLTLCIEKGRQKCEKYWPNMDDMEEDSSDQNAAIMTFNDISIELLNETNENDFVIRELKLTKEGAHHVVTQYHFINWPDFGCPENPNSLIHLIEVIRKQFKTVVNCENQLNTSSPILVHCSAGVGRSGTFIAVDRIMQMMDKSCVNSDQCLTKEVSIDIFGTVCDMRGYRPSMVQTEDQYIYIYDCVKCLIDRMESKRLNNNLDPNNFVNEDEVKTYSQIEQNSELIDDKSDSDNEVTLKDIEEGLHTGAHINRQFSLDESSSENTEL